MVQTLKRFIDILVIPLNFLFTIFIPLTNSGGGIRNTVADSHISIGQILCYLVIIVGCLTTLKTLLNSKKEVD